MNKHVPVVISLDNNLLRDGIALILRAANYRVMAWDAAKPLRLTSDSQFILLLGEHDQDGFDELAIERFRRRFPKSLIVLLLESLPQTRRAQIERLEVAGVLLRSISSEALLASLQLVMLGEYVFSVPIMIGTRERAAVLVDRAEKPNGQIVVFPDEEMRGSVIEHDQAEGTPLLVGNAGRRSDLSEREVEILTCLVAGDSNKTIARRCRTTETAVKVRLKSILRKTRVVNRTQAAVWALANISIAPLGLTEPNGAGEG